MVSPSNRTDQKIELPEKKARFPPLARKDALLEFYSKDLLMSARARAAWVEPDVKALIPDASVR